MKKVQVLNYEGNEFSFLKKEKQGLINATEMAKPFGKKPTDFLKMAGTKAYINALEDAYFQNDNRHSGIFDIRNTVEINVLHVENGGNNQGTWMDKKLALRFAQWLSPSFAIWVDMKLEELLTTGTTSTFNVPSNYFEALQLAALLEGKRIESEKELEMLEIQAATDKPKVIFYDAVMKSDDALAIGDAAKILNFEYIGRNQLFSILRFHNILMADNTPYQKYIISGHFEVVMNTFTKPDGSVKISKRTLVKTKGMNFLVKKLISLDYQRVEK